MNSVTKELSVKSKNYIKRTLKTKRKRRGQYFTPKGIREYMGLFVDKSELVNEKNKESSNEKIKILEPGSGTGEIISDCIAHLTEKRIDFEITGIEIDKKLFQKSEKTFEEEINAGMYV